VVAAALSALPAEYSSVIVETFYRRRSVPDTAELLGISADTVKVRCYEALRELKHALAERGHDRPAPAPARGQSG
jgi:RNA polymerase sigma-70 factor (ECF subfamily)